MSKLVLAGPGGDTPEAQCGSQDVAPLLSALYSTLEVQANILSSGVTTGRVHHSVTKA